MKKISKSQLRTILDKCGISTRMDEDGDSIAVLSADSDFRYDVIVAYVVNDTGWIVVTAYSPAFCKDHQDAARLIALCNKWNSERRVPKAYYDVERKAVVAEHQVCVDEEVSEEFIKNNCVILGISASWSFFKFMVK